MADVTCRSGGSNGSSTIVYATPVARKRSNASIVIHVLLRGSSANVKSRGRMSRNRWIVASWKRSRGGSCRRRGPSFPASSRGRRSWRKASGSWAPPCRGSSMPESLVGAGGWGYLAGGLAAYAKAFRFAEVNATFYRRIPESMARRWRARVPADFVFSVKAHRDVTHAGRLQASAAGREAFAHSLRTARILGAPFVILEIPASLRVASSQVTGLRDLAGMAHPGTRIGLEARAYTGQALPPELQRTMEDNAILAVVDLSQTTPRLADDTRYTRLFGPGPHNVYQFDDRELREIDHAGGDAVRVAFTFHGVRMYSDAARFLTFKRTGAFPAAASSRGLSSLQAA